MKRVFVVVAMLPLLLLAQACSAPPSAVLNRLQTGTNPGSPAQFQPSPAVAALSIRAGMTDLARGIFFSAQPVIDTDRSVFTEHCGAPSTGDIVELGCYTSDNRIYILNLADARLSGEMVVIAAHEMLHSAYAHLAPTQKVTINTQVELQMSHLRNTDLPQRLSAYRNLEPGQRDNELHSILGTEYAPLSTYLEQYYSQYFSNRNAIVADARAFDQVFSQSMGNIATLQGKIKQMRRTMQADLSQHKVAAYNKLVPQFNALVKQYNQTIGDYNALSRDLLGEESLAAPQ